MLAGSFRVGVTRDFLRPDGTLGYGDIGLGLLDAAPDITYEFLATDAAELVADAIRDVDALVVLGPRITARTLARAGRLALVARFGVGYDNVDVDACTRQGVLLTITPDGVRRPVAVSAIALLLALSHKLVIKDRLTRSGRWSEKLDHMGTGLGGRSLGVIGLGNIGGELCRLAQPFELRCLAFDPYATTETAAQVGATLTDLETLLRRSDFVCVCCALTPETHHLLDARRLALMPSGAYLVNVARGPIVDQAALTAALREGRLAGAALDVFEQEPVAPDDPLLTLDNVIVAPHAIAWTDELFLGNGTSACRSILDVAAGRVPRYVVNRAALDHPGLQAKLERYRKSAG